MPRTRGRVRTGLLFAVVMSGAWVGISAVAVVPAPGDAACSPRSRVVAGLDALFGEIQRAVAPAGDRTVVEFFSSRANGTWTLLRTLPDGRSCVLATGRGEWRQDAAPVLETAFEI